MLAGAAPLTSAAPAKVADPLEAAKGGYKREKLAIATNLQASARAAATAYSNDLQTILRQMEKAGDDFGIRPAKAEVLRFTKTQTVPKAADVGTPELIAKAQARYHGAVDRAASEAAAKDEALAAKYIKHYTTLQTKLEAAAKPDEAAKVADELERLASGHTKAAAEVTTAMTTGRASLPKEYLSQLRLLYDFEGGTARQVVDLSGQRQNGELTGATKGKDPKEGATCTFTGTSDILETKEIKLGAAWTLSVKALFPLEAKKEARVLISSAHAKHHMAVDARGILGLQSGEFSGCGYNVNSLSGWHVLTIASSSWNGTFFFVDGKLAGGAKTGGTWSPPVNAIGNSAAGGCPWSGTIASAMMWTRCLSAQEIAGLCNLPAGK